MSANIDAMVREGIAAYKAGKMDEARTLLMRAVELNEHHEMAWLWLSAVVDSDEDRQTCLENVLTINPNNESAQQGLKKLTGQSPAAAPAPPPPPVPDVPATPFNQPFEEEEEEEEEELPPSAAWDIPATETSSASSQRPLNEPSSTDYDDWVAGLGIGSSASAEVFGATPDTNEEDLFAASNFPFMDNSAATEDEAEAEVDQIIANEVFGGPFDAIDDIDETAFDESDSGPYPASDTSVDPDTASMLSPIEGSVRRSALDVEEEVEEEDEERFTYPAGRFMDEDDDDTFVEEPQDPANEDYFALIPQEIGPTRLPGTNERYPVLLILGLVVLVLGNIGAVVLLVMQLIGGL